MFESLAVDIERYCQRKSWAGWTLLAVFLIYIFYQHLIDPLYFGPLGYFNLIIHEAGHVCFMLFGETVYILGGTLLQLIIPCVCLMAFLRQGEYLGVAFGLGWIGDNLFGIAMYIADARARALPLITGDPDSHDWYNLLGMWGMLKYDALLGGAVKFCAVLVSMAGIVLIGVLFQVMQKKHISMR